MPLKHKISKKAVKIRQLFIAYNAALDATRNNNDPKLVAKRQAAYLAYIKEMRS